MPRPYLSPVPAISAEASDMRMMVELTIRRLDSSPSFGLIPAVRPQVTSTQ